MALSTITQFIRSSPSTHSLSSTSSVYPLLPLTSSSLISNYYPTAITYFSDTSYHCPNLFCTIGAPHHITCTVFPLPPPSGVSFLVVHWCSIPDTPFFEVNCWHISYPPLQPFHHGAIFYVDFYGLIRLSFHSCHPCGLDDYYGLDPVSHSLIIVLFIPHIWVYCRSFLSRLFHFAWV